MQIIKTDNKHKQTEKQPKESETCFFKNPNIVEVLSKKVLERTCCLSKS